MTINTNTSANTVQRHLAQHSRNLTARFKAASEGSGDIAELSSGLAKDKLLTTAATLVLRKANDLQARSIDLLA
jgi:tRNA U34 5-methylaminomethyl-2-thiouridine-forming methyltransferase MnmC